MSSKATMIFCSQTKKFYNRRVSVEAQEQVLGVQQSHPYYVMVWLGVRWREGFTKLHLCKLKRMEKCTNPKC